MSDALSVIAYSKPISIEVKTDTPAEISSPVTSHDLTQEVTAAQTAKAKRSDEIKALDQRWIYVDTMRIQLDALNPENDSPNLILDAVRDGFELSTSATIGGSHPKTLLVFKRSTK